MNNRTVTKVNMDVLRQNIEADYMDGDIILIDNLKEMPEVGDTLKMDMIIVLLCTEGRLQVDINGKTFRVNEGELVVCPPYTYLNNYLLSPKFNAKILGLSYSALQRMIHIKKNIWEMIRSLSHHPVYSLPQESIELTDTYYSLFQQKMKLDKGAFHKEVMQALFQAVFYDLCSILTPLMAEADKQDETYMKQGDLLLKRFLKLLAESEGKERFVTTFAEKLCVTPKYLTTVCKATSGKTALEWIHEYTTDAIVQQLKYSDRTVKEIADELGFPNISFFGKFVKARLGVSPKEYRKRLANNGE